MTLDRYAERDGMARWIRTAEPAAALADKIADTEFVPAAMRGRPAMVAACILYGDEIGVGPMQALASIHVVDGRPFPSAELLRALILADGHTFRVLESTGTRCTVMGVRAGHPDTEAQRVTWDIEMARAAGLAGKGAWRSYPRALLLARASTDLARMMFPDVVKGLGHVPDSPDVAADYDGMAAASGLPDDPAPVEPRQIQWKGARRSSSSTPPVPAGAAASRDIPTAGPDYVPRPDGPPPFPEAPRTAPTAAVGPDEELDTVTGEIVPKPKAADEGERPVSREQVTRIMAAYGDLGYDPSDRAARLALFSALLGQPVGSTNDLERMTAYRLLGALARLRDGTLIAVADGHGGFTIHPGQEPEPDE